GSSCCSMEVARTVEAARVARPRTLRWAIGDLRDTTGEPLDTAAKMSPENLRRAQWLLDHGAFDLPNWLRPACHRDKPDHKYKSMYGRLRWGERSQTPPAGFGSPGQGRYLPPDPPRKIPPHEAPRLQVFPDWFSFRSAP